MQPILPKLSVTFLASLVALQTFTSPAATEANAPFSWPAASSETKPWTRWWWLGSAVDKTNLTHQLEQFAAAGLGGVEICPIYGVKGYEDRHIDFLSPKWMEMLAHATKEAKRLGLGFDMTTGTGWPFGGPNVTTDIASAGVTLKRYTVAGGATLTEPLAKERLQSVMAFPENGAPLDLTAKVKDGKLDWTAPSGQWRLHVVSMTGPVMKVKRAAPGGVGNVLDAYSIQAMDRYLADFDKAFADWKGVRPRAQFHDSFEYYGATWTPDLFQQFERLRGYDLRTQLPALSGEGPADTVARVKTDYRETMSDLHLDFMRRWGQWTHAKGGLVRNQAHGAPANLVDLYAASDIPETEIFGSIEERNLPMNKFASSAAHLTGRRLASSESFTWLDEHFHTSLDGVKHAADYLFLSGVNHVFFHGIPYSPQEAAWPGWQFYAAVNFGPQGGLWRDLPAFNAYVSRVQSVLQSGKPDNDVLLYFPVHDIWNTTNDLLMPFTVHNAEKWLEPHPTFTVAQTLWGNGYGYDLLSDAFLAKAKVEKGRVVLGENSWKAIVVPRIKVMPEQSLQKLADLARAGAKIVFQDSLPETMPGFASLKQRQAIFQLAGREMESLVSDKKAVKSDLKEASLLSSLGFMGEPMAKQGLRFIRRVMPDGHAYFIANRSAQAVDQMVTLPVSPRSAVLMDPLSANRIGLAKLQVAFIGSVVRLQLQPSESVILRTYADKAVNGPAWPYRQSAGDAQALAGTWKVQFIEGGPELPKSFSSDKLASWTTQDDPNAKRFAGTARYTLEFDRPTGEADGWLLDLGKVAESARVRLNGQPVATLWCAPLQTVLGRQLKAGKNTLEIEVTNLAANRIRDMDQRKVNWKYFHDANLASKGQRGVMDASGWRLLDSGLLGPVTLQPVRATKP
jgi:hypothetical protein